MELLKSFVLWLNPVRTLKVYSDYIDATNRILSGCASGRVRAQIYCIILLLACTSVHFVYLNFVPKSSRRHLIVHFDFVHLLLGDHFSSLIFAIILLHAIHFFVGHYLRPDPELNALFDTFLFGDATTLSILPTFWGRSLLDATRGFAVVLWNYLQLFYGALGDYYG